MVVVPLLRSHGGALLSLLVLFITAPATQPAIAQSRPFPVTVPRSAAALHHPESRGSSYGKLPLSFEQNRGQAPADVRYLAHGQGFSLALTETEARIALRRPAGNKAAPAACDLLRMHLAGAAANVPAAASGLLPGKVNYLVGRDAQQWRTDIATFRQVHYRSVYPGVDLVYYGNQQQLEYDFVVAPNADPSRIALKFDGAQHISVDRRGELVVRLKNGSVRWHKPTVYQQVNGKRKQVAGQYMLKGAGRVGFALARYDVHRPLVIDPVLLYSTYIGGSGADQAYGIAIDSVGNAYIAGTTTSQDFPGTTGGFTGSSEAFITKLNATGTALVYSLYLGGTGDTNCWSIAVDAAGNAYVAGDTTATNFPVVRGYSGTSFGGTDAYVARISAAGNSIVYSTYLGGSDTDTAQGIALGPNGNAYVVGYTASPNFPASTGLQKTSGGGLDAFVARIDTSATGVPSLIYSSYLGGTGDEHGYGIAVDSAGRFYVTGDSTSIDFPVVGSFQSALVGVQNAFVSAFAADGSALSYSTYLGGENTDTGFSIAVDANRNAYITGTTGSTSFPTRNPFQSTIGGAEDAFVAKFNTAAIGDASLVYSTFFGGGANDAGRSIAVDVWGNAYIAGDTDSNFSPFRGSDPFVAKLGADGSTLLFGALVGGTGFEANLGIAIDVSGTAYITGYTSSTDFPIEPGAMQTGLAGILNAFVFKMPTFTKLDFNHDGQSGLLFQNANDGHLVYWTMNGDRETRFGSISPSNPGTNWNLVATSELNGDSNTDLIFQNSATGDIVYWLMNGTNEVSFSYLNPKNPGAGWKVVGTGDFNRDGYNDILFQNSGTGDLFIWNLRGGNLISGGFVSPQNPGAGWKVAAVGDLNGDGQPDILFQNSTTGSLFVWYMHGSTLFAGGFLNPANPGAGWNVVGLADLNGDGQPEILFQNATTGQLSYWVMDGANVRYVGAPKPANPGGAVWKLVGPR